ncbi:MAG: hypothetical protein HBSAPP03_09870 [Phycisphaerae bacterium]|nr:MAG: hypothetical protein HBSAPP03_09870 [Phycisphaerae bacterium]
MLNHGFVVLILASATAIGQAPHEPPEPALGALVAQPPKDEGAAGVHDRMVASAVAYLRSVQHASGGWSVNENGPTFPAITGLAVQGVLGDASVRESDPMVAKAVAFMLSKQQPDGGIYDRILPTYNTAICLTALASLQHKTPEVLAAIGKAQEFLKGLQYGEGASALPGTPNPAERVGREHPFYGGWGYGNHGRPDLSNTAFIIEALRASGVSEQDAVFQRALVFLQRCQMVEKAPDGTVINAMEYAKGSRQGGFIYATSVNKDERGVGQSQAAGVIEETLDDGTKVSRLRAYGSMTYSGFKSYLYAGLSRNDPRVTLAREWIGRHYTLEENPGAGTDGLYYYYVVFARANEAFGEATVPAVGADGVVTPRDWRGDLVARLATLQQPDGSFRSVDDRWMENNPVLITAYSLVALRHAK